MKSGVNIADAYSPWACTVDGRADFSGRWNTQFTHTHTHGELQVQQGYFKWKTFQTTLRPGPYVIIFQKEYLLEFQVEWETAFFKLN